MNDARPDPEAEHDGGDHQHGAADFAWQHDQTLSLDI
jgi:hypothetical protein